MVLSWRILIVTYRMYTSFNIFFDTIKKLFYFSQISRFSGGFRSADEKCLLPFLVCFLFFFFFHLYHQVTSKKHFFFQLSSKSSFWILYFLVIALYKFYFFVEKLRQVFYPFSWYPWYYRYWSIFGATSSDIKFVSNQERIFMCMFVKLVLKYSFS